MSWLPNYQQKTNKAFYDHMAKQTDFVAVVAAFRGRFGMSLKDAKAATDKLVARRPSSKLANRWKGAKRMKVETLFYVDVTQQHINAGTKYKGDSCAITLAVADAVPQASSIVTGTETMQFVLPDYDYKNFELSEAGRNFVNRFDTNLPVEPFCLLLREL